MSPVPLQLLWRANRCLCSRTIIVITALISVTPSAHAERFLESFLRTVPGSVDEGRAAIVKFYRALATTARKNNDSYAADHFARRSAHFLYFNQRISVPAFFPDEATDQKKKGIFEDLSNIIVTALDCTSPTISMRTKLSLVSTYEKLYLEALSSARSSMDITKIKRLRKAAGSLPQIEGCLPLGRVPVAKEPYDWNLQKSEDQVEASPTSKLTTIKEVRPVFGTALRGPGPYPRSGICDVYFDQRTVYFDIGDDQLNTPLAREQIKAVRDGLAKQHYSSAIIEGHADEPGGRTENLGIAARRAIMVGRALGSEGVEMRLIAVGANCPQRQGLGATHAKENRRVTIKGIP